MASLKKAKKSLTRFDTRPPWIYYDPDYQMNVSLSFVASRYPAAKRAGELRVQSALDWTTTQPATEEEEDALKAGIGNWVILNTLEAKQLIKAGRNTIKHGWFAKPDLLWALVKKLKFEQLSRAATGAQTRDLGIQDKQYLDLSVITVKAIRAKIQNLSRLIKQNNLSVSVDKQARNCIRRITKLLACGFYSDEEKTIQLTGEVVIRRSIVACKTRGCGNPTCVLAVYHRKKAKYQDNVLTILNTANKNPNIKAVYLTIVTDYPNHDITHNGKQAQHYKATAPTINETKDPLLVTRLVDHKQAVSKFLRATATKRLVYKTPHRITEFSFLPPTIPGRRAIPNPHTHAVAYVDPNTDPEQLAVDLTALYRQYAHPDSLVMVSAIVDNDPQEASAAIGAYDAKEKAITGEQTPLGSEAYAALDDRTIAELAFVEDFTNLRLYQSSVRTTKVLSEDMEPMTLIVVDVPTNKDNIKKRKLVLFSAKNTKTKKKPAAIKTRTQAPKPFNSRQATTAMDLFCLRHMNAVGSWVRGLGASDLKVWSLGSDHATGQVTWVDLVALESDLKVWSLGSGLAGGWVTGLDLVAVDSDLKLEVLSLGWLRTPRSQSPAGVLL